jgi:hypothetical protein
MQTHIAIERSKCNTCKPVLILPGKTWCEKFGWGGGAKMENEKVARRKGRDTGVVDTAEIVRRRWEWKKEIEERIVKREKEKKRLASLRERGFGTT